MLVRMNDPVPKNFFSRVFAIPTKQRIVSLRNTALTPLLLKRHFPTIQHKSPVLYSTIMNIIKGQRIASIPPRNSLRTAAIHTAYNRISEKSPMSIPPDNLSSQWQLLSRSYLHDARAGRHHHSGR